MNVNRLAADILVDAIGKPEFTTSHGKKNPAVGTLGHVGGFKGSKATQK
jgi:hypothetical protein